MTEKVGYAPLLSPLFKQYPWFPLKRIADTLRQEKATRQAVTVPTNTESALSSPFNPLDILTLFILLPKGLSLDVQNWGLEKDNWQMGRVNN